MPSAARVLTLIVSICHTVQAGRLSIMGTQLLRHFAHNHAQNEAAFKHGHPVQMRFRAGAPASLAENPTPETATPETSPYTFASPTGNGKRDFTTPFYGFYSHHYGPVYQLLTPNSGYGGYPGSVDPRGFNARTQNFTGGVFAEDLKTHNPNDPNKAKGPYSGILGQNALLAGYGSGHPFLSGMAPGVSPGFTPGLIPGMLPGAVGPLLPVPGSSALPPGLHIPANGLKTVVGQIPGTIPIVYPNGQSQGLGGGVIFRPAVGTAMGALAAGGAAAAGAMPVRPFQTGAMGAIPGMPMTSPQQAALAGFPMRSPYNPTYSAGMMQHHQLTLNGAANGFGSPGLFQALSEHYPTPDADHYHSVIMHPVLPPNYGNENKGSGSGA